MYSSFLQIILIAQLTYLATCQEEEKENQVMVRDKRQTYTVYYLCGSPPNNYLSRTRESIDQLTRPPVVVIHLSPPLICNRYSAFRVLIL